MKREKLPPDRSSTSSTLMRPWPCTRSGGVLSGVRVWSTRSARVGTAEFTKSALSSGAEGSSARQG
jgi:hypothetical protein